MWILTLLFGKPSEKELKVAAEVRKLFENAEKEGYEIEVTKGCISKRRKVDEYD